MAIDRRNAGLVVIRICLGVFFIMQAASKLRWGVDSSILGAQLSQWLMSAAPGSISQTYLQRVAAPGTAAFARLVPRGQLVCGPAPDARFSTPLFPVLAAL